MRPAPLPHTIPTQKDLYSSCLLSCFEQHVILSSNGLGLAHSAHFLGLVLKNGFCLIFKFEMPRCAFMEILLILGERLF